MHDVGDLAGIFDGWLDGGTGFAMVDPQDLHWFGQPVALSAQAVYTLAFLFWVITMLASAMTVFLISSPVGCKPWSSSAQKRPKAESVKC